MDWFSFRCVLYDNRVGVFRPAVYKDTNTMTVALSYFQCLYTLLAMKCWQAKLDDPYCAQRPYIYIEQSTSKCEQSGTKIYFADIIDLI
jgi:hypothetical protein